MDAPARDNLRWLCCTCGRNIMVIKITRFIRRSAADESFMLDAINSPSRGSRWPEQSVDPAGRTLAHADRQTMMNLRSADFREPCASWLWPHHFGTGTARLQILWLTQPSNDLCLHYLQNVWGNRVAGVLLCGRPNRQYYKSCPSVRLPVCLSVCLSVGHARAYDGYWVTPVQNE